MIAGRGVRTEEGRAGAWRIITVRMRQSYFEIYLPSRKKALAPATQTAYAESLRHWERLTGDPSIEHIAETTLRAWAKALCEDPDAEVDAHGQRRLVFEAPIVQRTLFGPSVRSKRKRRQVGPNTADKHLRWARAVLRAAEKAGARSAAPPIPFYDLYEPDPRPISEPDLEAIYRACEVALEPQIVGVWPAHWWRALLCVAVCCGTRRAAILGLHWEQIDFGGRAIRERRELDKSKKPHLKALPPVAIAHLMRIRNTLEGPFVWTSYEKKFDRQWHAIQRAAGIPKDRHYRFHSTKATCGTQWAKQGAEAHAVQSQLGHAQMETGRYYVRVAGQFKAAEQFELPACFSEDFSLGQKQG